MPLWHVLDAAAGRPDPLDTMLADLADGDPAKARYAAWYLVRMRQVRPDILIAMINTGPTMDRLRDMANVVERYAVRIDIAWPMLRPIVPHLRPGAHDLALYALAALYPEQPEPEREWFRRELEAASEPGRASQTAATLLYLLSRQ
jgi:hypothetical protein